MPFITLILCSVVFKKYILLRFEVHYKCTLNRFMHTIFSQGDAQNLTGVYMRTYITCHFKMHCEFA